MARIVHQNVAAIHQDIIFFARKQQPPAQRLLRLFGPCQPVSLPLGKAKAEVVDLKVHHVGGVGSGRICCSQLALLRTALIYFYIQGRRPAQTKQGTWRTCKCQDTPSVVAQIGTAPNKWEQCPTQHLPLYIPIQTKLTQRNPAKA